MQDHIFMQNEHPKHNNRSKTESKKDQYFSNQQVPQGYDIVNKEYSLQPDMIFGWVPKLNIPNITPFCFENYYLDRELELLDEQEELKLIYKGQRFPNSLALHQRLMVNSHKMVDINQYQFNYPTKGQSLSQQYQEIINAKITWNSMHLDHPIQFDSDFECGNLDVVIQASSNVYHLWMRPDTNTKGHYSWFFFTINNKKQLNTITLIFKNFVKPKSLYNQNMRPYFKSLKSYQQKNRDWTQDGSNISFKKCKNNQRYYELSVDYKFEYIDDTVYVCYCIPYSYSNLLGYLNKLKIGQRDNLCKSLGGLDIPLIHYGQKNPLKPTIVINARIHPGESNSSWIMHQIFEFFENEQNQVALEIMNSCNLIFIPMLNPDGVVIGNYRTSFSGKDLNRQFKNKDSLLFPEVESLKNYLRAKLISPLAAFFDLHGHQVKKNSFVYGPQFELNNVNSIISKAFAKLLSQKTPIFRYEACIFKISQGKITTLRAAVCQMFNSPFCYTVETSNGFYYNKEQMKSHQIEKKDLVTLVFVKLTRDQQQRKAQSFVQSLGTKNNNNKIKFQIKKIFRNQFNKLVAQQKYINFQQELSKVREDENNSEGLSDSNPSDGDYDENFTNDLKQDIIKIRQKICRYFNAPEISINTQAYKNANRREILSNTINAIQQVKARVSSFNKSFQIRPISESRNNRRHSLQNNQQNKISPKSKIYKMNTQMISLAQFVNAKNFRDKYFQKQNIKQTINQQKNQTVDCADEYQSEKNKIDNIQILDFRAGQENKQRAFASNHLSKVSRID